MDKRENIKLKMYQGLEEVLSRNEGVLTKIPAFSISYADFLSRIKEITDNDKKYQNVTKGVTSSKDRAEDEMIETIIALSAVTAVFARRTGDENLREIVSVRPSKLKKMRDMDLLTKAKGILDAIRQNQEGLSEYAVKEEDVKRLADNVWNFENSIEVQEDSFAQSKAARQKLAELFDETDEIISEELDLMVERVREKESNFYSDYQSNRVLVDF